MNIDKLVTIIELTEKEKKWWASKIKTYRDKYIKPPEQYLEIYNRDKNISKDQICNNISQFIFETREGCWEIYLQDEVEFHKQVITNLIKTRELPNQILDNIISNKLINEGKLLLNKDNMKEVLSDLFGDYTGRIMPYIYQLNLSTTNSRRSRAGKTFEKIIAYIMKLYNYPFIDQTSLGRSFYTDNGLGKMVDGVIPGAEQYVQNRSKCQIISMKTTLRERWQEVVEELNRTNIPHIFLLTLDDKISEGVLLNMKQQNITVVNYDEIKNKYKEHKNIISYSEFFNNEIPHTLAYWEV